MYVHLVHVFQLNLGIPMYVIHRDLCILIHLWVDGLYRSTFCYIWCEFCRMLWEISLMNLTFNICSGDDSWSQFWKKCMLQWYACYTVCLWCVFNLCIHTVFQWCVCSCCVHIMVCMNVVCMLYVLRSACMLVVCINAVTICHKTVHIDSNSLWMGIKILSAIFKQ